MTGAPSNVSLIFRKKMPRANPDRDAATLSCRRLAETMGRVAFADHSEETLEQRASALAAHWHFESKLPCKQLRLIAGTLDIRRDFELRLAEVHVAAAESELFSAKIRRVRVLQGNEAAREMYPENEQLFERYRQATMDMANTPVFTKADLRGKRSAIGESWLRAEGAWYDQLRAAVAADEERLDSRRESGARAKSRARKAPLGSEEIGSHG